jgi:hypothetical protein
VDGIYSNTAEHTSAINVDASSSSDGSKNLGPAKPALENGEFAPCIPCPAGFPGSAGFAGFAPD